MSLAFNIVSSHPIIYLVCILSTKFHTSSNRIKFHFHDGSNANIKRYIIALNGARNAVFVNNTHTAGHDIIIDWIERAIVLVGYGYHLYVHKNNTYIMYTRMVS